MKKNFVCFLIMTLALLLVCCKQTTGVDNVVDNPPAPIDEPVNVPVDEVKTEIVTLTLYFPDNDALYLHPEKREVEISKGQLLEEVVVSELFKGPESEELSQCLSGENLVNSIVTDAEGNCVVDFKRDFILLNTGGSTRESFAMGSIVNSLCELENVNSVAITFDGESNVEFGHYLLESSMLPMTDLVKS